MDKVQRKRVISVSFKQLANFSICTSILNDKVAQQILPRELQLCMFHSTIHKILADTSNKNVGAQVKPNS
jgi:hypothetical protein